MMVKTHIDKKAPILKWMLTPVSVVQDYFSIHQNWSMFAPNPGRRMLRVDALIEYRDGSSMLFPFPTPNDLTERYLYGERLRKFQNAGLGNKKNAHLWPDAARWILRTAGTKSYTKIPKRVTLFKAVKVIPPLSRRFFKHLSSIDVKESRKQFFTLEL